MRRFWDENVVAQPDAIQTLAPFAAAPDDDSFDKAECMVYTFYCAMFFEVAGRLPTLPRRLPTVAV